MKYLLNLKREIKYLSVNVSRSSLMMLCFVNRSNSKVTEASQSVSKVDYRRRNLEREPKNLQRSFSDGTREIIEFNQHNPTSARCARRS